jgi:hypothetical protein
MPIPLEICPHVIALHFEQPSCHTIAKKLETTPSTICRIIKHYKAIMGKLVVWHTQGTVE